MRCTEGSNRATRAPGREYASAEQQQADDRDDDGKAAAELGHHSGPDDRHQRATSDERSEICDAIRDRSSSQCAGTIDSAAA